MRITYAKRKRMRSSSFALPRERKYPVIDKSHGKNALARVEQHGTTQQKRIVRRKVHAKFPSLRIIK